MNRAPNWNRACGWHPVERICSYRGYWVEIARSDEDEDVGAPWCVQCCGNGYYFKTKEECYAYCYGRKFIRRNDKRVSIQNQAEALAYCRGRRLHRVLNSCDPKEKAWQYCTKYGLCEVS